MSQAPSERYDRIFVGREQELTQLRTAYDAAASGGQLVMLAGEPGIGKTTLCGRIAEYARLVGGAVLTGHCHEERSLPYGAFAEAIRDYVRTTELGAIREQLAEGATEVALLVPEIRDHLDLQEQARSQNDRWLLFQAVVNFLRNAGESVPLLLILEDLHWADSGTLDMLAHISHDLGSARLLIVGTYRDIEVDRSHPLSGALGELRRDSDFQRIALRGLSLREEHQMFEASRGDAVPQAEANLLHEQTEGNPLYVQEVLRYLVEKGLTIDAAGRYVSQGEVVAQMPEGLRDVIGRRLDHLSKRTNQVLSFAAVIGREFQLDVLQQVAGLPEEELLDALEEATARFILEQRESPGVVAFRFSHVLFRTVLYEEAFTPRRNQLHRAVGQALEAAFPDQLQFHAGELAEHFSHSSTAEDLVKAVSYGELAARRAMDVYDYGDAVRLSERAIEVFEVLSPGDKSQRCDLLLGLGAALVHAGEPRRVLDGVAPEALVLAEALNDRQRVYQVCEIARQALVGSGAGPIWASKEAADWAEAADRFAESGSIARVWADLMLAYVRAVTHRSREARIILGPARELASRLDDNAALWAADVLSLDLSPAAEYPSEWLALAKELISRPRDGASLIILRQLFVYLLNGFYELGQREALEAAVAELTALAKRTKQPNLELLSLSGDARIATLDGRFEELEVILNRVLERGEEVGLHQYAYIQAQVFLFWSSQYLGKEEPWAELHEQSGTDTSIPSMRGISLAYRGQEQGAREIADELARELGAAELDGGERTWWQDTLQLTLALRISHEVLTSLILKRYKRLQAVGLSIDELGPGLSRLLGEAALLIEVQDARSYFESAIDAARRARNRPELALSKLHLAELLLDHDADERAAAIEHLDFAIAEFEDMRMQPALDRALTLRNGVRAITPSPTPRHPDGLTERQLEVLRLIGMGRTNREIATELTLSLRTVERHIEDLYPKIGVRNRSEAAIYARERSD